MLSTTFGSEHRNGFFFLFFLFFFFFFFLGWGGTWKWCEEVKITPTTDCYILTEISELMQKAFYLYVDKVKGQNEEQIMCQETIDKLVILGITKLFKKASYV
jgi:hypothetical protein